MLDASFQCLRQSTYMYMYEPVYIPEARVSSKSLVMVQHEVLKIATYGDWSLPRTNKVSCTSWEQSRKGTRHVSFCGELIDGIPIGRRPVDTSMPIYKVLDSFLLSHTCQWQWDKRINEVGGAIIGILENTSSLDVMLTVDSIEVRSPSTGSWATIVESIVTSR